MGFVCDEDGKIVVSQVCEMGCEKIVKDLLHRCLEKAGEFFTFGLFCFGENFAPITDGVVVFGVFFDTFVQVFFGAGEEVVAFFNHVIVDGDVLAGLHLFDEAFCVFWAGDLVFTALHYEAGDGACIAEVEVVFGYWRGDCDKTFDFRSTCSNLHGNIGTE